MPESARLPAEFVTSKLSRKITRRRALVLKRRAQCAVWHVGGPEIILSPGQGFMIIILGNTWSPEARVGARKESRKIKSH